MGLAAFNRMRRLQAEKEESQTIVDKPLDKMGVKELEAYAESKGIDLSECKNKEDKLNAILKHEGGE